MSKNTVHKTKRKSGDTGEGRTNGLVIVTLLMDGYKVLREDLLKGVLYYITFSAVGRPGTNREKGK